MGAPIIPHRSRRAALGVSEPIADHATTVGPTRETITDSDGVQPGDPARAAAIRTALDAEVTPLRLPLGDDAVDAILGHLDAVAVEVRTWEPVSRATAHVEVRA
jgi:hypothetical protein